MQLISIELENVVKKCTQPQFPQMHPAQTSLEQQAKIKK